MPSLSPNKSMLSKRPQMGKIRNWGAGLGAKLSGGGSTEKQDLASEVEQRKKGIDSLYTSTEAYWSYLGKKKPVPFDTLSLPVDETSSATSEKASTKAGGKMLPVEALGLAMTSFGAAFPEGSAYGACLGLLGEAHIKLGYLQSTFTKDTSHIFLARIARSKAVLDSFTAALKKLDSATIRLETAQTKVHKSKKEKRELEEELRLAKAAYDEAVTDVEARGEAIQDSEYDDWQCLTTYMQAQLDYMGQAHAVLEQVKSVWGDAPPAGSRSGTSTPLTRPRSLSGPKMRPSISRKSSAKDAGEITATSSRFGSRSSLSLSSSDRPQSITEDSKDKEKGEKKNRLRMPSFSGATDTVASVASGLGSFGRSKSSSLFSSSAGGETPSVEKERDSSKWNFSLRSKKEQGFMSMDEAGKAQHAFEDHAVPPRPELPERDYVRPSVSALDVHLGDHDDGSHASPDLRVSRVDDSFDEEHGFSTGHGASPFSPDATTHGFIDPHRHGRLTAHETIHERGESQLSAEMPLGDSGYLGVSSHPHLVQLNHTGLSTYSDGADPFTNGSAMSPHATHGRFDGDETSDEEERQGLTAGSLVDSTGEKRLVLEPSASWKALRSIGGNPASSSPRGPPPPVPSSASFLSKSKSRLAPPPPPLPSRNSA